MAYLEGKRITELELQANLIRQSIVHMLQAAGSGHTAGPLDMADIFTAFYFHILKHDPKNPLWEGRDRVILSNGHICPVLYAAMAHSGYFPIEELQTLRKLGSRLQGHPHREWLPGIETSSGPLGSGLSQAVGMALANRINEGVASPRSFYCFLGDGELNAGNNWEAAMLAGKERLHNVIAIVDRNNIQIDGFTEDIMPLEPLGMKWRTWNWHVQEIDGHNMEAIVDAVEKAKTVFEKPSIIIARTIASKGVSFAERDFRWHGDPLGKKDVEGDPPKEDQVRIALEELKVVEQKLRAAL